MNWSDVLADPSLRDLPYKVELNGRGQPVLSRITRQRALAQGRVILRLAELGMPGLVLASCPVESRGGVIVADAAWASHALLEAQDGDVLTRAPEICVEVVLGPSADEWLEERVGAFLEAGALEVWACGLEGRARFFAAGGPLERSLLAPGFRWGHPGAFARQSGVWRVGEGQTAAEIVREQREARGWEKT